MSKAKQHLTIKQQLLAIIEEKLDDQNAKGLKNYGQTIDDVDQNLYDWSIMALEESLDANQYLLKEIIRLRGMIE
ncbi:MAG TPA: hypothetical protein VI423_03095 [Paenisporosarcina sp.]|nr:hypothetical protein [Paenisporosarcina sp.]